MAQLLVLITTFLTLLGRAANLRLATPENVARLLLECLGRASACDARRGGACPEDAPEMLRERYGLVLLESASALADRSVPGEGVLVRLLEEAIGWCSRLPGEMPLDRIESAVVAGG